MRKTLKLALLLCACALLLPAVRADERPTPGADLLAKARKTYAEQGAKTALPEFEAALAAFRAAGDSRDEAITIGLIGNCYKKLGDYSRAQQMLEQALAMKRKLGDRAEEGRTLSHLGLLFWEMGNYPKAIDYLTQSIEIARQISDRKLEGASLNNLSLVYDEQGDYQRSLEQYQRALELHRATGFARGESDTLGNIGGVYLLLGRYREALGYYQQALAIDEREGLKPSMVQDLGNIGFCYLGLGRLTDAQAQFGRGLQLAREAGMKKEEAELHKGLGSGLVRLGKFNAALTEYATALQVYEAAGLKKEKVEGLGDRGAVFLMLGDLPSAERDFSEASGLAQSIGNVRGVTANLLALGDLEAKRGRHERAAVQYRAALERSRAAADQDMMATSLLRLAATLPELRDPQGAVVSAKEALEIARKQSAAPGEAEALLILGDLLRRQGELQPSLARLTEAEKVAAPIANPDLNWQIAYGRGRTLEAMGRVDEAISAYRQSVEIIEGVHSELKEERYRSGYLQDKSQVYIALIRLLLRRDKAGEAFSFAERLRAQGKSTPLERNVSPEAAQHELELRLRIQRLHRAIEEESAKGAEFRGRAAAVFSEELQAAQREYQNLLDDRHGRRSGRATVATAERIRQSLPADAALLEYVVADDSVLIFVLTRDQLRSTSSPVSLEELETRIELFRDLLNRRTGDQWRPPAESLRHSLVDPIEAAGWLRGRRRLFLVPQGVLHYLPFAALARTTDSRTRFLVEDYVLQYLPSASTLAAEPGSAGLDRRLFALAPSRSHLLFATREVQAIQTLLPHGARLLVGTRATESDFKRLAGDYGTIHLATHGFFNKVNPLFSGVELEPDARDDGRLEVHEVLELRLRAGLVTLSACETALGTGYYSDVPAGDDFVGLTDAFLRAGSSSVLATLWEVNDRSTSEFMTEFYRRLERPGGEGDLALATAQRRMLASHSRFRHPYYWAPFVLVGSSRGIQGPQSGRLAEKPAARP
ncbi:MAG: tetratricopeptide repeat protein [Acidobacteriota bacterium]|nr:tetratricopeptide repeat protein [Acidobacteriota bacterium]